MEGASSVFWILLYFSLTDFAVGLTCYLCPPTRGDTVEKANIECLALGWEMSCAPDQDRCFSKTYLNSTKVEKGCTRSENCIGITSCCQTLFCNGDPQTSQTGYGQPCNDLSNCIQRSEVMRCDRDGLIDVTKRCLCTERSYQRGATCKRKSYPDESCSITSHCLDVNTTCVSGLCRCDSGMYPNVSRCDLQVSLGALCLVDKQCGGANTQCAGERCTCDYGYTVINGTDSCSGGSCLQQCRGYLVTLFIPTILIVVFSVADRLFNSFLFFKF